MQPANEPHDGPREDPSSAAPPPGEPWYVRAFGADYRTVYPHRDLASARREVADLCATTGLAEAVGDGRVLDLCCGFGRHSLALLEAGLDVAGVDLSAELLAASSELPGGDRLRGRLVRADARAVPLGTGTCRAVVNLFSSFGYFGEEGDVQVLHEVARILAPRGMAVLDLMNPARIRAGLVPRSDSRRGEARLIEERSLAPDGRRVVKEVTLEVPGEAPRRWREDVRLYDLEDLLPLATAVGLDLSAVHGDFGGAPFGPAAERQLCVFARSER